MPDNDYLTVVYDKSLSHLSKTFDCGNDYLNMFLRDTEAYDAAFGVTYVWLNDDRDAIRGYYNIGTGCVETPYGNRQCRNGGAVHVNCFALAECYHKQLYIMDGGRRYNMSDTLLNDCISRVIALRESVGFEYITLDATPEGYSLYERNGFFDLEEDMFFAGDKKDDGCRQMYYPIDYE